MPCLCFHDSIFLNMEIFHIIHIYGIKIKGVLLPEYRFSGPFSIKVLIWGSINCMNIFPSINHSSVIRLYCYSFKSLHLMFLFWSIEHKIETRVSVPCARCIAICQGTQTKSYRFLLPELQKWTPAEYSEVVWEHLQSWWCWL